MIDDDLHAKVYIADDTLAIITSANFTKGGLKINKEVRTGQRKPTFAAA